jgi:hypothetical protein
MIVTVDDYRLFTGDCGGADADVEARLAVAQELIEENTDRVFDYGTYTEVLPVWRSSRVYPRAVPLASPGVTGGQIERLDGYTIQSTGIGFDFINSDLGDWVGVIQDWEGAWAPIGGLVLFPSSVYMPDTYTAVTYTGGYGTPGPAAPAGLRMAISRLAYGLGAGVTTVSSGVVEAQVGDVRVRYADGAKSGDFLDELVPGLTKAIRRFRRPVY